MRAGAAPQARPAEHDIAPRGIEYAQNSSWSAPRRSEPPRGRRVFLQHLRPPCAGCPSNRSSSTCRGLTARLSPNISAPRPACPPPRLRMVNSSSRGGSMWRLAQAMGMRRSGAGRGALRFSTTCDRVISASGGSMCFSSMPQRYSGHRPFPLGAHRHGIGWDARRPRDRRSRRRGHLSRTRRRYRSGHAPDRCQGWSGTLKSYAAARSLAAPQNVKPGWGQVMLDAEFDYLRGFSEASAPARPVRRRNAYLIDSRPRARSRRFSLNAGFRLSSQNQAAARTRGMRRLWSSDEPPTRPSFFRGPNALHIFPRTPSVRRKLAAASPAIRASCASGCAAATVSGQGAVFAGGWILDESGGPSLRAGRSRITGFATDIAGEVLEIGQAESTTPFEDAARIADPSAAEIHP